MAGSRQRKRAHVAGSVQGVGFRPFVFRLAERNGLSGWVANSSTGAELEVEGDPGQIEAFARALVSELPAPGKIETLSWTETAPRGDSEFRIVPSDPSGDAAAVVLADLVVCEECRREIADPSDRRYRYPFANCTRCGPRFSIVTGVPYDRPLTTMAGFPLCPACRSEYEDVRDRRFHAQPIACPACGPILTWHRPGDPDRTGDDALFAAAHALEAGEIVALKGIGGFQLLVRADDEAAVRRLRERKGREAKPLALMAPSLEWVESAAEVDASVREALAGAAGPIVLLKRRTDRTPDVAPAVAPGCPNLGVMVPTTPLHALLLSAFPRPVVATSGNRSEEPICTREPEAFARLGGIADGFLVHNRPIARAVDDSVVRPIAGRPTVLRRARGYAPRPHRLPGVPAGLLAVGGHMKNAVALSLEDQAVLSPHIGDLDDARTFERFEATIRDLSDLYRTPVRGVVHDAHPDYLSTQYALGTGLPTLPVQHHAAHALAAYREHALEGPALAVVWDGTGWGPDGTVWGGEFLRLEPGGATGGGLVPDSCPVQVRRVGRFRPFVLPGGDAASRQTWRSAVGVLHAVFGEAWAEHLPDPVRQAMTPAGESVWRSRLARPGSAPATSSVGRLFDALASLLGLSQRSRFEGDAAMLVEWVCSREPSTSSAVADFPCREAENGALEVDLLPAIVELCFRTPPESVGEACTLFHAWLAAAAKAVAVRIAVPDVLLTGGCFQNDRLATAVLHRLEAEGFRVWTQTDIPPNDGGLAFGQLAAAIGWNPAE
ncbi:MAG: carbamoyltransferase HypF [Fimbriimonadaceae bacterium]